MNKDELCEKLKADGWTLYKDNNKPATDNFFKRGIQIRVLAEDDLRVEVILCGELPDESWLTLTNYAFGEITSLEQITKTIPRLLAMWECANQTKQ